MLQPFAVAEATLEWYRRYVRTSFPLADPLLEAERERLIDAGLLWAEPYVALGRPGRPGPALSEMVGTVLSERVADVAWGFDRLYDHQARAIRRLVRRPDHRPEPTLVLSGTGSGKTEGFLIPIVDACLSDPRPGVRAVLLYPMNALANDQLSRLRSLLAAVPEISFGRYTGDAPEVDEGDARRAPRPGDAPANLRWSRQAMRDEPPSILITNYTMLEYLLLRGDDRGLFAHGAPDYLVVDEIHLFSGILGAEVAALLRRFRAHVGAGPELCVVGTSATAGSESERRDLVGFASRFFGIGFDADALIVEEPVAPRAPGALVPPAPAIPKGMLAAAAEPEGLVALARAALGTDLAADSFATDLGRVIDDYATVGTVEAALGRPAPVSAAAHALGQLAERAGVGEAALLAEAQALLLLGAAAMVPAIGEDQPEPRFRPRVHQVLRSLAGLWRCADPAHPRLWPPDGVRCDCGALTLPTATCRTCGEAYWHVPAPGHGGRVDAVQPDRDTPSLFLADPSRLADLVDTDEDGTEVRWSPVALCPVCGAVGDDGRPLDHASSCAATGRAPVRLLSSPDAAHCPACGARGASNRPVLLALRGSAAASVAVVTQGLSDLLRAGTDEPGGRLLVFSDSRQDAAQQAGYADDQGGRVAVRQLVAAAVASGGPIELPGLLGRIHAQVASDATAMRRWLVGTVERNFAELSDPDYLPSKADLDLVERQLDWEVILELTERARRRFSLEQEGVVTVELDDLEGLSAELARGWRGAPLGADGLAEVLAALADVCRYTRAVDHWLLLRSPRDLIRNHHLRVGDRAVTATRGFAAKPYQNRAEGLDIRAWTRPKNSTRLSELLGRVLGVGVRDANDAVDAVVERAEHIGLLAKHKAGGRSRLMLDHKRLTVAARTDRPLWRCERCGSVRPVALHASDGRPLCINWHCPGTPAPWEPSADRAFYRDQYRAEPRRLVVREHSAQVESDVRLALEARFNDRDRPLVDVLSCTPTLEVGVSLDDLHGVVLRNLPPTPANYAQRVGRAGRRSKVALAVAHAGHRPHDSYFFAQPGEMIAGAVTAPAISLDNLPVLRRHLNSLILATLGAELPRRWFPSTEGRWVEEASIADADGVLREDSLAPVLGQLAEPDTHQRLENAARAAFAAPSDPSPPPAIDQLIDTQIAEFPAGLRRAFNRWCDRYRALVTEWKASTLGAGIPSQAKKNYQDRLYRELVRLSEPSTPEYQPLGFLGLVGFLPRYGFSGEAVLLHPAGSDEPLTQAATVAITTFAPGNVVYARGRRLKIRRIEPAPVPEASAGPEHRDNVVVEGRRCDRCEMYTTDPLQKACPICGDDLVGQDALVLTGVGAAGATISADDETRRHSYYDVGYFLAPVDPGAPAPTELDLGAYRFTLTRQRRVTMANRGKRQTDSPPLGFEVCTHCGHAEEIAARGPDSDDDAAEEAAGHRATCPARTDPHSDVVRTGTWVTAEFQGDVAELRLPSGLREPSMASWRVTLAEALLVGIQETMRTGERDLGWFERLEAGVPVALVFYDTMPGGTGYLPKLFAEGGDGLRAALGIAVERLEGCTCDASCHRCLRDFWNQRHHALLDRFEVIGALRRLAGIDAVAGIDPDDARLESFLEEEFYGKLQAAGLPAPTLQVVRVVGQRRIIRVDAEYRSPDVSIFLDGRAYHSLDRTKIMDDLEVRNSLEARGVRVLEYTYADVLHRFDDVAVQLKGALGQTPVDGSVPASGPGLVVVDVDEAARIVTTAVDVDAWVADEQARQGALQTANRMRLAGWRLTRRAVQGVAGEPSRG